MAGTSKGFVFRPTRKAGRKSRFYWAKYRDAEGSERRHALKLSNGDGVTDKSVAEELLRQILNRVEREAAGLIDKMVEAASKPIRSLIAGYIRHLRRERYTRGHVRQVLGCLKTIVEHTGMKRLADFDEDRIHRALGMVADKGRAARTVNVYRRCAGSFAAWCVKIARVLDRNPDAAINLRKEATDRRKQRRYITIEQARRLLAVCGPRRLFYAVQLWTGLRVSEVRALRWSDFVLDGPRPCIRLRAEATKAGRADELPLHPTLVPLLVEAKPTFASPNNSVVQTTPILRTFKADLARAGIATKDGNGRIVTADERGHTLDRHALRTTFVSWLGQYGVDLRAQIKLARHAPRGVTLRNYQDFSVFVLWAEIRKLPGIEPEAFAATGTDDASVVSQT